MLDQLDQLDASRQEHLVLRCNTLITLALSDFLLAGREVAGQRFAEAETLIDELDDDDLRARLAYQRANIDGRSGDLARAWEGLVGARARLGAFSPREQCAVHLSYGMLAYSRAEPAEALAAFAEAARLARLIESPEKERMARHNEGYATFLTGDLPRALAIMTSAAELPGDISDLTEQLDRGEVLLEAGLVSDAIDVLRAGRARSVGPGHQQLRASYDLELARAHRLQGGLDSAVQAAELAREAFARLGATAWEARAALVALLADLDREADRLADPAATAAAADRLVETASTLGDDGLADTARAAAAAALLAVPDLAGAERRLADLVRQPASLSEQLVLMGVRASVHAAAGRSSAARRVLANAARRLEVGLQGSASLDVRTARAVHGVRLARIDLQLALASGAPATLEALERWRSATDRLPSLGRPEDERLAQLTEQLRAVLARVRSEPVPPADLEREAERLQRRIRARDWALGSRSDRASSAPLRVREARRALDDAGRDLVWLFRHQDRLCGIGIVRGRLVRRDLMALAEAAELAQRIRVDLRAAATRDLGPLHGAVWGSLRSSVARFDDALVRPWRSTADGLVLVTGHDLAGLPWALLPSLHARPLTMARSLTAFARRDVGGGGDAVAAPGSVVPDRARPAATGRATAGPVRVSVGPAVARATHEARAIAAVWPGRVEIDRPSSGRRLVAALAAPGVVHVAAHGIHEVQSPLFSSVTLHDGPMFAHELQRTGVRADHVVLSACEVGSAVFRPGEEPLGLAASMLSLGARSVVAAVSPVPDSVAADVMAAHHRGLAAGRPSDEALALAIADNDPVSAAFVHLGGRYLPGD